MEPPSVPNLHEGGPENPSGALTWAALLARWTDFARASAALPTTGAGGRWRDSVAPIITLQAVCHALGEVGQLPAAERALGLDRAEVLISESGRRLGEIWDGAEGGQPRGVGELLSDVRTAMDTARAGQVGAGGA